MLLQQYISKENWYLISYIFSKLLTFGRIHWFLESEYSIVAFCLVLHSVIWPHTHPNVFERTFKHFTCKSITTWTFVTYLFLSAMLLPVVLLTFQFVKKIHITFWEYFSWYSLFCFSSPAVWTADAEIKVPSVENVELKGSPVKALSRSEYNYACYTYCQGFLSC